MRKYEIILFTSAGKVTELYNNDPQADDFISLEQFEQQMKDKHGTFVMLSSNPI